MSAKDRLQESVRRLEAWEGKLPGFGPFHAQREATLHRLRSHAGSFFKLTFGNQAAVDELLMQSVSIDQLGAGLDEIFQKVAHLLVEIEDLGKTLRAQDSGPFAASVEQRHSDWRTRLEPLGKDVARTSELKGPRQAVKDYEHAVAQDRAALEALAEAVALLPDVDQDVGRVGLEGDLKRWRDEFLRNGASFQWTEQVRRELKGYRKKSEEREQKLRNQPGRAELSSLERESIPLATYWAHTLENYRGALPPDDDDPAPSDALRRIGRLSERIRLALSPREAHAEAPAEAAAEIGSELDALLESLASAAASRSKAALRRLRTRLKLFCDACGVKPDLDPHIAKLEQAVELLDGSAPARPDELEVFAASLSAAKTEFEGLAANQRGRLATAALEVIRTCNETAKRLLSGVHPRDIAAALEARRSEIPAEPAGEPQAQESLRLLDVCNHLAAAFQSLDEASAAAFERFQSRRRDAGALHAGAAFLTEALDLEPTAAFSCSAESLAGLEHPEPGLSLEHFERDLEAAESAVANALADAQARARELLAERRAFCLQAGRALEAVRRSPPSAPLWPSALEDLTPDAIRTLLEESAAAEAVFRDELGRVADALRRQTEEHAQGLRAFVAGVAESGDSKRLWAEDLLGDFEGSLWLEGLASASQVLAAAAWLDGHQTFQEDLRHNEARARELREQLRALQLEIQKDSRQRYCPALFERGRRLLEGVPEEPADWQQAVSQLTEAERTLRLADQEARRRIALELRETCKALHETALRTSDPALRRNIEAHLARLAEQPPETTPPSAVRRPLIYQARQLGMGTSRTGRR